MSEFSVRTDALMKVSSDLQSISDKIKNIASQADSTLKKTRRSCTEAIVRYGKDKIAVGSILCCGQDMLALSAVLSDVSAVYKACENNVKDKKFAKTKKKIAYYNGVFFTVGQDIAGFKVVSISDSGEVVLERDKHIILDGYENLSQFPFINNFILGPLMAKTGFDPEQLRDVKQKIVIQTLPQGGLPGEFNGLNDFEGKAMGNISKISYYAESDDYKSEFEYTVLEGTAEIGVNPLEGVDWLSPATLLKANVTVANIKGSVRFGSEDNNIKIGFDVDGPSAGAGTEDGIGNIEYTDAAGNPHKGNGYTQEKELAASVVSGRVYVQGTINGVENTIAVSGDAVAAGAGGEVAITDTGASASIDAELIAGIGLAISSVWGD